MKTYTLAEEELINELTCACALGRKNALEGLVKGAEKHHMPSIDDMEFLLSSYNSVADDYKKESFFVKAGVYKKVEHALDRNTKKAMLVSAMEALVE